MMAFCCACCTPSYVDKQFQPLSGIQPVPVAIGGQRNSGHTQSAPKSFRRHIINHDEAVGDLFNDGKVDVVVENLVANQ